jgi:RNA polymerase sigma-B factor
VAINVSPTAERARLIEQYLPLVESVARRFGGHGEQQEDLEQVGALALVRAVDRRDPARMAALPAYLGRCVEGEVLRHLRDRTAVVRVPRALQNAAARETLGDAALATLATARRPAELGAAAEVAEPTRLDELTVTRELVADAIKILDARERQIVLMRFFLDCTQAEVAESLGISQAHVSRLLEDAFAKMRRRLERPPRLSGPEGRARVKQGDGTGSAAAPCS